MSVRYYDASHPLVLHRTGDPARGEWAPKDKRKHQRSKKPRRTGAPRSA